jgi:ACS family tartrate transporter-like MFS transporter
MVSALGSLGGFVGPNVIGVLKESTGSYTPGMIALALALILSAAVVVGMGRAIKPRPVLEPQKT